MDTWTAEYFAEGLIEVRKNGVFIGTVGTYNEGRSWRASGSGNRNFQRKKRPSAAKAARDMWGTNAAEAVKGVTG
jgi:hypothetical protein